MTARDLAATVPLRKIAAGKYATLDGRYLIDQQPYERECDCSSCQGDGCACPNGGWATDWFWCIWDVDRDDYMEGTDFSSFTTLREAREHLA